MEELRRLRKAKGLSQAKLAVMAGLDPSTVSQIETGARRANTRTLERLAAVLETEVADLFPKGQAPLPDFDGRRSYALGRKWASDDEYETALELVKEMYRKRYQQIHSVKPVFTWPDEEAREVLADVSAAHSVLEAVGISEERPEGFWMHETMVLAWARIVDGLRAASEAHEEGEEVRPPVIDFEEAVERLRAA